MQREMVADVRPQSGGGYAPSRIEYIDAMKGFAILLVVLGHIGIGYYNANVYPEQSYIFYTIYNIVYAFHMPLFMSLSGYVYYTAYYDSNGRPALKRIWRQVKNLAAIYLIFGIPMGLVKVLAGNMANEATTLMDVALIPVRPMAPYWYLYVLIILYLVFAALLTAKISRAAVGLIVIVAAIGGDLLSTPWLALSKTLYYSLYFYLGVAHRKYSVSLIGKAKPTGVWFGISLIMMILFWSDDKVISNYNGICIITAVGIVLAVWYIFEKTAFLQNNRFLIACGRYSLEIYVIHHTLAAGIRSFSPRIGIRNAFVSMALNFVLSTAIPVLFSLLCKKMHVHGLLFKPVSYFEGRKTKKD